MDKSSAKEYLEWFLFVIVRGEMELHHTVCLQIAHEGD